MLSSFTFFIRSPPCKYATVAKLAIDNSSCLSTFLLVIIVSINMFTGSLQTTLSNNMCKLPYLPFLQLVLNKKILNRATGVS